MYLFYHPIFSFSSSDPSVIYGLDDGSYLCHFFLWNKEYVVCHFLYLAFLAENSLDV